MPRPRLVVDPRDQEVLRATRELAAYFKGERTEREARAALKIIKAFIRDRQHTPPGKRRPLPGMKAAPEPEPKAKRTQKPRRRLKDTENTEDTGVHAEPHRN